MSKAKWQPLLLKVQDVLFREWDPLSVNANELCRDEYDSYAIALVHLLQAGADEYKIAARLSLLQRADMGLAVADEEANRRVARKLLSLI
jgi:hypothetical protein